MNTPNELRGRRRGHHPAAVDRGWEKACRCTVNTVDMADAVRSVARAAVEPRAAMSERPS